MMIMKSRNEEYGGLSKNYCAVQQEPSLSPVQDQPEDLSIKKVINNTIINTTTNTNLEPKSNLFNHHDDLD